MFGKSENIFRGEKSFRSGKKKFLGYPDYVLQVFKWLFRKEEEKKNFSPQQHTPKWGQLLGTSFLGFKAEIGLFVGQSSNPQS